MHSLCALYYIYSMPYHLTMKMLRDFSDSWYYAR